MNPINNPLSNVQLEILKAFSHNLSDEELKEFRKTIADFFAKKAIEEADKSWEANNWNDDKVDYLLNKKLRKKSTKK